MISKTSYLKTDEKSLSKIIKHMPYFSCVGVCCFSEVEAPFMLCPGCM